MRVLESLPLNRPLVTDDRYPKQKMWRYGAAEAIWPNPGGYDVRTQRFCLVAIAGRNKTQYFLLRSAKAARHEKT